jgi:hypothetical protein
MSGTGVDPRIALGFQQSQNNMLQNFMQAGQVISALSQAQANNEMLQARRQIGAALQNSIDPVTGQLDTQAFMGAISRNPMAGFLAPEALAQARAAQLGQLQVQQNQAALGMRRLDNLSQVLTGLLENPQLTRAQVVAAVGRVLALPEAERPFSAQTAAAFLGDLPEDPRAIRQKLMEVAGSVRENQLRLLDFLPRPHAINLGGNVGMIDLNPRTAPGLPGSRLEITPTPGELNEPRTFIGPSGEPRQGRAADVFPMTGGMGSPAPGPGQVVPGTGQTTPGTGQTTPPGQTGAVQPPGAQSPGRQIGSGRYPSPDINPPGSTARPPTTVPPQAPGGVAIGLPPGRQEAMEMEGQRSAQYSSDLASRARFAPENIANLQQMRGLLRQVTTGGPVPSIMRRVVTALNAMLPENMRIASDGIAYQEEFVKLAERLAQQQRLAFAGASQASNMELESARIASPNEGISNLGNDRIIAHLLGNEQAILVRNRAWQQWRNVNGAESFMQFEAAFDRDFDPRVFHSMFMSPQDRARMVRDMTPGDRRRFENAVRAAIRNGWVTRQDLGLGERQ